MFFVGDTVAQWLPAVWMTEFGIIGESTALPLKRLSVWRGILTLVKMPSIPEKNCHNRSIHSHLFGLRHCLQPAADNTVVQEVDVLLMTGSDYRTSGRQSSDTRSLSGMQNKRHNERLVIWCPGHFTTMAQKVRPVFFRLVWHVHWRDKTCALGTCSWWQHTMISRCVVSVILAAWPLGGTRHRINLRHRVCVKCDIVTVEKKKYVVWSWRKTV